MNTDPVAVVRPSNPLDELAVRIRREHTASIGAVRKGVEHARRAGELLVRAKALCRHGEWLPWVERHLPELGPRQVQRYMRLAARWAELTRPGANASGTSDLSIDGALAILADPERREPEPEPLPPEAHPALERRESAIKAHFDNMVSGLRAAREFLQMAGHAADPELKAELTEQAAIMLCVVRSESFRDRIPAELLEITRCCEDVISLAHGNRMGAMTPLGEILNDQK
jgi:hypothetical protein